MYIQCIYVGSFVYSIKMEKIRKFYFLISLENYPKSFFPLKIMLFKFAKSKTALYIIFRGTWSRFFRLIPRTRKVIKLKRVPSYKLRNTLLLYIYKRRPAQKIEWFISVVFHIICTSSTHLCVDVHKTNPSAHLK